MYCRKFAAEKNVSKFESFGFPKFLIRSSSDVIVVTDETGPYSNAPAIAPIDVATAGTTFVKSTSFT